MDMGSATKSDNIFVVFDKTSWFGTFLAVLLLFFSRWSSHGATLSLFALIKTYSIGQNMLTWSKHAQCATSDLNEFVVHPENFVDRRLPIHHSLAFGLSSLASIAGPRSGAGLLPVPSVVEQGRVLAFNQHSGSCHLRLYLHDLKTSLFLQKMTTF